MRRLIAALILTLFTCIMILAQQTDKQTLGPKTPAPTGVPASDIKSTGATLDLLVSQVTSGQSQTNSLRIRPSAESRKQDGPFVVLNGAVYMPVLGARFLIPLAGGGASGCFSLDLPKRITILEEFVPNLDALKEGKPQLY